MRLKFDRLPLNQVIARFTLATPLPVSLAFFMDLKDALATYPEVDDQVGLDTPPGMVLAPLDLRPQLQIAQFRGAADGVSVQVQSNLISVRWDTIDPFAPVEQRLSGYPGFDAAICPAITAAVRAVESLLPPESVRPIVANMVYTNFLESAPPLTGIELEELFPACVLPTARTGAEFLECMHSWRGSRDVDLRFAAERVISIVGDRNIEGYGVKTSAGSRFSDPGQAFEVLDLVHEEILVMFASILSESGRSRWGLSIIE